MLSQVSLAESCRLAVGNHERAGAMLRPRLLPLEDDPGCIGRQRHFDPLSS